LGFLLSIIWNFMEAILEILKQIPKGVVAAIFLNGGLATLAYFIFWKKYKTRFRNWRIQLKERADWKQIKSELANSILVFIIGAFFSSVVTYLSTKGYTKIYTDFSAHSAWLGVGGFFMLLLIDDAWFYWMHRLLHHPKLFPLVHVVHHKSVDVNPFTSVSFHWVEAFVLTLWIFPVAFFIPVYAPVLGLIQVWGLLDNVKSHLGYELYPAGLNRSWLRFLTSSTHHNMHHSKFKGNYGVHFRFWDRLMKTEFKEYEAEYDKIQERKRLKDG
jgi:Delta7-sterol 5-desaturase